MKRERRGERRSREVGRRERLQGEDEGGRRSKEKKVEWKRGRDEGQERLRERGNVKEMEDGWRRESRWTCRRMKRRKG